jgi:SAM-dependent methyltransferase
LSRDFVAKRKEPTTEESTFRNVARISYVPYWPPVMRAPDRSVVRCPPRLEPTQLAHHFGGTPEETLQSLDDLCTANRYFGGTRSILESFEQVTPREPTLPLRILDVGCGRADGLRAVVLWARRRGIGARGVGIDLDAAVVRHAAAASRELSEITIIQGDARRLPFPPRSFDFVFSSMLLHYFASSEAPALLAAWGSLATRTLIISDVERHWVPCVALSMLRRISSNSLVGEGSSRTVLRGFTRDELVMLAAHAGFASVCVRRFWPFRLAFVAFHPDPMPAAPRLASSATRRTGGA